LAGLQEGARSGRPSKLDADQLADLQRVLRGKPSDVGLAGTLWDRKTIGGLSATNAPGGAGTTTMPAAVAPMGLSLP
jgi:transposase